MLEPEAFTERTKLVVCIIDPAAPLTTTGYAPAGVLAETDKVKDVEQPALQDAGEKEPLTPAGRLDTVNDTGCVVPDTRVELIVLVIEDPWINDLLPSLNNEKSKLGEEGVVPLPLRRSV